MVTAEKSRIDCRHIDVLDGIRAVSVIIVLIFHFWQQTWIFPVIKTPWLAFVGITKIDFSNFATVGYLFVDMMVLISGFLLFFAADAQHYSRRRDVKLEKLRAQTHCANRAELLFCRCCFSLPPHFRPGHMQQRRTP